MLSVRRAGVEPAKPEGGWVTATWACQCPTDACCSSSTGGSRTHIHQGLNLVALPHLAHRAVLSAPPIGFEPTISCVTGRRALLAAPRGRSSSVAQVGIEPTASLGLSLGGLPVAYRAAILSVPKAGVELANIRASYFETLCRTSLPIGVSGHPVAK